jgi:hypothetical protein
MLLKEKASLGNMTEGWLLVSSADIMINLGRIYLELRINLFVCLLGAETQPNAGNEPQTGILFC